ncbi:MAG: class I SAM-dependent methyltransferase [Acidobacteriia bacterium]|nr:class I SAM-dependent methyltransferase [Terriglobia bacterium]
MAYTPFDRFVAWCRFRAVAPHIRAGSKVCDLGCGAGAPFLEYIESRIISGVGLDEHVGMSPREKISVVSADITANLPLESAQFDHVTMLAVLEHLAQPVPVIAEAYRILRPQGTLVMTWPSPAVDPILEVLTRVGLVNHELGFDQHQPRIPMKKLKEMLRKIGFTRFEDGRFEMGLNNWLVAHKGI